MLSKWDRSRVVEADTIVAITEEQWVLAGGDRFTVASSWITAGAPVIGDYMVVDVQGTIAWMSAQDFEAVYTRMEAQPEGEHGWTDGGLG